MRNGCDSLDYNFYLSRSIDYRFFFTSSQSRSAAAAAISREARETEGLSLSKHQRLPLRHFIKPKIIFSLFTHSANNYMCCRGERKSLCAFESHIEPRYRLSSRSAKRNKKLHRTVSVQAERAAQALVSTKPQSQSPAEYHRLASQQLFSFTLCKYTFDIQWANAMLTRPRKRALTMRRAKRENWLEISQEAIFSSMKRARRRRKKNSICPLHGEEEEERGENHCVSQFLSSSSDCYKSSAFTKKKITQLQDYIKCQKRPQKPQEKFLNSNTQHTPPAVEIFFCLLASASLI